jgi:hypothetical protein
MEAFIKSSNKVMKQMMELIKSKTKSKAILTMRRTKKQLRKEIRNKKIQHSTNLQPLRQKASIKGRGQMLGTREK